MLDKKGIIKSQETAFAGDTSEEKVQKMTLTNVEFLKLASATINRNYSGNPLQLQSFIDSIDLLKTLADSNDLKTLLKSFVLSKLEGTAREYITNDVQTVEQIIAQLKSKIRPESSKVIEGKMQALKADRSSMQNFTKQAEELADCLKRSLVMEGISLQKAEEMSIEKTVEMCRASARSDLVKAILSSTKFNDPKEVVAKFIVETNAEIKEKQVLAYHPQSNRFARNGKNFGNGNNQNRIYTNNYNGRNNGNRNNFNPNNVRNNFNRNSNNQNQAGQNRFGSRSYYNSNNKNVRYTENLGVTSCQQGQFTGEDSEDQITQN